MWPCGRTGWTRRRQIQKVISQLTAFHLLLCLTLRRKTEYNSTERKGGVIKTHIYQPHYLGTFSVCQLNTPHPPPPVCFAVFILFEVYSAQRCQPSNAPKHVIDPPVHHVPAPIIIAPRSFCTAVNTSAFQIEVKQNVTQSSPEELRVCCTLIQIPEFNAMQTWQHQAGTARLVAYLGDSNQRFRPLQSCDICHLNRLSWFCCFGLQLLDPEPYD